MEKTIKLIKSFGTLDNNEPFIIADNDKLTLTIESEFGNSIFYANFENAEKKMKLKVNKTFDVPQEMLTSSVLNIVISIVANGKIAKKWNVEPIVIVDIDEGFEAHTQFQEILDKLKALEVFAKMFEEKSQSIETLSQNVERLKSYCKENATNIKDLTNVIKGEM